MDRRVRYVLRVGPNVDFVAQALREIDPRISVEASPDGGTIILRGDVPDARTARLAKHQAELLLRSGANRGAVGQILNLLRYPGITASPEDRLAAALEVVDPRIRVRRIQVGLEADPAVGSGDDERAAGEAGEVGGGPVIRAHGSIKVDDDNNDVNDNMYA